MQRPLNIAVLGAGGIAAKLHLPELAEQSHRAQVALLLGRNAVRLGVLGEQTGARWSQNWEEALGDESIDAVIVATPHPQHVAWGIRVLQSGKHLLMQKPLCTAMNEADEFVAAADEAAQKGIVTFVLPHFKSEIHETRRRLHEGAAGKIVSANARTAHAGPEVYYREVAAIFGEELDEENLWFFDVAQAEAGALFDMGVYAVAHLVALLGGVRRVSAFCATLDKPTTLEDSAALLLEMRSGALAVAETGWCDGARSWQMRVQGTRGKFEIEGETTRFWAPSDFESDHADIREETVVPQQNIGSAHNHWLDCIEAKQQPPLSHARAARHVTEILLAARQSARSGQIMEIHSLPE